MTDTTRDGGGSREGKKDVTATPRKSLRKKNKVIRYALEHCVPEAGSGSPGDEEATKTLSVRAPVGPPPTFQQTKYLRLKLTPRAPRPR